MTGLLHISDRLLAGELSRVEAARGILCPLGRKNTPCLSSYSNPCLSILKKCQCLAFMLHLLLCLTAEENWPLPAAVCAFCVTIINIQKGDV